MNLGIDGTDAILHNNTAAGSYSRVLIEALGEYCPKEHFYIYTTRVGDRVRVTPLLTYPNVRLKECKKIWFRKWWRAYGGMAKQAKRHHVQVFHGVGGLLPMKIKNAPFPSVLTIHDLSTFLYPNEYGYWQRLRDKYRIKESLKKADRIIALSQTMRDDLLSMFKINPEQINIVYPAVDKRFCNTISPAAVDEVRARYRLPDRFVLVVSQMVEHKNVLLALKAFEILKENTDLELVMVGEKTDYYNSTIHPYAGRHGLLNRIRHINRVHSHDMAALVRAATVSAIPSRHEGFGLTIVEAQACGVPVVAADVPVLRETGGDGAVFVDPDSPEQMAEAINKIVSDDDLRTHLIERGTKNKERFSAANLAQQMMVIYRELRDNHSSSR